MDKNEPKIVKLSDRDFLNEFSNVHRRNLVSARINILVYRDIMKTSKEGEKTPVGEKDVLVGRLPNGQPAIERKPIKAIDALLDEERNAESQERILRSIEKIDKELKD